MKLGEILLAANAITAEQLDNALGEQQRNPGTRLGSMLIGLGQADADLIAMALAKQQGFPPAKRAQFTQIAPSTLAQISGELAEKYRAIPLGVAEGIGGRQLVVAFADPKDIGVVDAMEFATGKRIKAAIAPELVIRQQLQHHYGRVVRDEPEPGENPGSICGQKLPQARTVTVTPGSPPAVSASPPPTHSQTASSPRSVALPSLTDCRSANTTFSTVAGLVLLATFLLGGYLHLRRSGGLFPRSGSPEVDHLGLTLDFPDGWHHVPAADIDQQLQGMGMTAAYFYRGGSLESPEHALFVATLDTGGALCPDDFTEQQFEELVAAARNAPLPALPAGIRARLEECDLVDLAGRVTGRCFGVGGPAGARQELMLLAWIDDSCTVIFTLFLARDIDEAAPEFEQIAESIEPA